MIKLLLLSFAALALAGCVHPQPLGEDSVMTIPTKRSAVCVVPCPSGTCSFLCLKDIHAPSNP